MGRSCLLRWRLLSLAVRRSQVRPLHTHTHDQVIYQRVLDDLRKTEEKPLACNGKEFKFLTLPKELSVCWRTPGVRKKEPGEKSLPLMLLSRECYDPLYQQAMKHFRQSRWRDFGVVFLGNPGIGKSGFLLYILWRLLRAEESVILKIPHLSYYICCHFRPQLVVNVTETATQGLEAIFSDTEKPWFLADRYVSEADWAQSKFILTSSPKKSNYHEFEKPDAIRKLYVPVWKLDELYALNKHQFGHDEEEVKMRFDKWGGIPRYVLGKIDEAVEEELQRATGLVADAEKILDTHSLPDDVTHKVFHMDVQENSYSSHSIVPASDYVKGKLFSLLPGGKAIDFISKRQPSFAHKVQGMFFEWYLLGRLIPYQGGRLLYRELQKDGELGQVLGKDFSPVPLKVDVKATGPFGVDAVFPDVKMISDKEKGAVFKPVSGNNGAWDFLLDGCIYQLTVSEKRALPLLGNALKKVERAVQFLRELHGDEKQLEFCILVPEFALSTFVVDWKQEMASTIENLKLSVKVSAFQVSKVCTRCKGMGVLSDAEAALADVAPLIKSL